MWQCTFLIKIIWKGLEILFTYTKYIKRIFRKLKLPVTTLYTSNQQKPTSLYYRLYSPCQVSLSQYINNLGVLNDIFHSLSKRLQYNPPIYFSPVPKYKKWPFSKQRHSLASCRLKKSINQLRNLLSNDLFSHDNRLSLAPQARQSRDSSHRARKRQSALRMRIAAVYSFARGYRTLVLVYIIHYIYNRKRLKALW